MKPCGAKETILQNSFLRRGWRRNLLEGGAAKGGSFFSIAARRRSEMTVGGGPWPYSPVRWLAPGPPVSRTNQDRLISPDIVPNPRFSAAWETPQHDACLGNFANFQIAIFRRELDR